MEKTVKKLLELIKKGEDKSKIETRKECLAEIIDSAVVCNSFYELPNVDFFDIIEKADITEESTIRTLINKTRESKGTSSVYLLGFLNFESLEKRQIINLLKCFEMRELYQTSEAESHLLERSYEDDAKMYKEQCQNLKKEIEALKTRITESSIKKPSDFEPNLKKAVEEEKFDSARYIIEGQGSTGSTLLHYATKYLNLHCIDYIIKNKLTDINTKDSYGQTALHLAASYGFQVIIKKFVEECHANIEVTDDKGRTPLFIAVLMNRFDTVKYLIEERHANIRITNEYGCTLVHVAASTGSMEILKYLINRGLSAEQKDNNGLPPLFTAANMGHLEIVQYLVETCHVKILDDFNSENVTYPCYKYLISHK